MPARINDERMRYLKQFNWDEIKSKIAKIDYKLFGAIEAISLNNDELFTEVSYPFGMDVIQRGQVYLPMPNGEKVAINDHSLPKEIISSLYGGDPNEVLGIILDKTLEFYLPVSDKIISHSIIKPGDLIGFKKILSSGSGPIFPRNLRAGARNIFILPKISDKKQHVKLQKAYHISDEPPISYWDQGDFFSKLAQKLDSKWAVTILFFPNTLVKKLHAKDPTLTNLYNHLLSLHRSTYGIWHNDSLMWDTIFTEIEQERKLQTNYFQVLDTVKHALTIAANSAPGFIPATNEDSAPIKIIQEVYIETYGMPKLPYGHFPTIMIPAQIASLKLPLYYSFNYPTLPKYSPTEAKSILAMLDMFMRVMEIYKNGIIKSDAKITVPSLYAAITNNKFECYHPEPGNYSKSVKNSNLLPLEDKRFKSKIGAFAAHSSFLKGCIKISRKK